jgi:hypothetical protein
MDIYSDGQYWAITGDRADEADYILHDYQAEAIYKFTSTSSASSWDTLVLEREY